MDAAAAALADLVEISSQIEAAVLLGADGSVMASTLDGSVFVVRDGERLIAAITGPEPTVGLVFYDLKAALRQSAEVPDAPKPRRSRKKAADPETESADAETQHAPS